MAAAAALAGRGLLQDTGAWPFPPGLVILGVPAVLLVVRPSTGTVLLGAAATVLVLVQILTRGPRLWQRGWDGAAAWALTLEVTGLALALVGAALLTGLVIFVPLYGCPELVIREVGRRAGLGWPGLVLLAAAFGLLQAGVVDESLFSADYRAIGGWTEEYRATLVAPLGISAAYALTFVGGHVVFSICAPIALVETARPAAAARPWLDRSGLALAALGYLAASALVLVDHRSIEGRQASSVQLAVTVVLAVLLVAAAWAWRRRRRPPVDGRAAVGVGRVFLVALALAVLHALVPSTWLGVVLVLLVLGAAALALARGSRGDGWGLAHLAAAAAAPLLVRAVLAFTYDPLIGEVATTAKLGHNAVMLALVLAATGIALRPLRRRPPAGPLPVVGVPPGRKAA